MKDSPWNLVMSALLGGRKGPRPPVGNPTSIACHGLMDAAGVSFPQAHLEAEAMAELALAGHEILGFDTVMPQFSVAHEAAALGCSINWGDRDHLPEIKASPWVDSPDLSPPEDFLEKPALRVLLEAISILRRRIGGRVVILGKVMGPWLLSGQLVGLQNLLLQIGLGRTAEVSRIFRRLAPVSVALARAQFAAGADAVVLGEAGCGTMISPAHYEELLLPLHQEITARMGGPLILHVCGNCADRLDLFARSGVDAYHFEWQVDARQAVAQVGAQISLVGNVNIPQVLLRGSPDEVRQQARYAIEAGVRLIAPECAIPLATPLANLRAIVEAAREGY